MALREIQKGVALVVGGGFIGSHVTAALVEVGVSTRLLTRSRLRNPAAELANGSDVLIGDVSDPPMARRALDGVSTVFYCAGGLLPAQSNLSPEIDADLTIVPLLTFLHALAESDAKDLTYISSGGTVYGNPKYLPVNELHPTSPISSYGKIRLASERWVYQFAEASKMPTKILRCSNIYGPGQPVDRGQGLVATALNKVHNKVPIKVFGDGSNVRDFLHVDDVVSAVLALVGEKAIEVLNVGSGQGTSIIELLSLIEEVTGSSASIVWLPKRNFDVQSIVLDVSRLRCRTGFHPIPLKQGLEQTWAEFSKLTSAHK